MNNISEHLKNINLVDLKEFDGVELRHRGSKFVCLCLLHDEIEPSFYIYPNNRFKCYGCGQGGDAADLIQALYG